jgi:glycosyltransferase involved in cell wall biosynthesis
MPYKPVLAVVIPVYNEEQRLPLLLNDWQPVFKATGVPYRLILIDDGSRDNSLEMLRKLAADDPSLEVHTQPNAGHGPAILKGYRLAAAESDWVFQIDSDHQLETDAFPRLWAQKDGYHLLLGQRREKNASQGRRWISRLSKWSVRWFFGPAVRDVNSPYRLMRSECLRPALEKIPANSFAPNVLITSWFIRKKHRIFVTPVEARKVDVRSSRMSRYFFIGALRSFQQLILFRIK